MEQSKDIKIYGTLVNHTVDPNKSDATHHDALAYAKELYDDRFGMEKAPHNTPCENYQDRINKRVKGITYQEGDPGVTTINGDLVVTGDTNLEGGLEVDGNTVNHGDVVVEGDTHVTNLYVSGETDLTLNDLKDVDVDEVKDKQALIYDMSNGKWIAGNPNGVKKLDDLEDVESSNAHTGDTLIFDDDTNTWTYGRPNLKLDDVADVDATFPERGETIVFNPETHNWESGLPEMGIGDLKDVRNATPTAGKLLMFNGTVWVPASPSDISGLCLWKIENKVINGVSTRCLVPDENLPIWAPKGVYDGEVNS